MKQLIDFQQGSETTGDSGERDDNEAIKPVVAGEPAKSATVDRPLENLRQRSETLRRAGEDQLYLQDSDMRWILTAGRADGMSSAPLEDFPGIASWDPGTGIFTTSESVVVQPLNTIPADAQETKDWEFPAGVPTATVSISPTSSKRAYNHANLIRVVWEAVDPVGLPLGALATLTGDPEHIVTIQIANDDTTIASDVSAALNNILAELTAAGIEYSVTGSMVTLIRMSDIPVGDDDYTLKGNYERELHYIPVTSFSDFFVTVANRLADGDTLSIYYDELVEEGDIYGRRQSVPSNISVDPNVTTVAGAQLFNTRVEPEKIPLSIPLCKRIGDDLIWLDGTIILGTQASSSFPILFGENGKTLDRFISSSGAAAIGVAGHASPGGASVDEWTIPTNDLQAVLEDLQAFVNDKGSLNEDEDTVTGNWTITGNWDFQGAETQYIGKKIDITALGADTAIQGTGGPTDGYGVIGVGQGVGSGVKGTGGSTGSGGYGVEGYGGSIQAGVYGEGGTNGPGVKGQGGSGNAPGVIGTGSGISAGVGGTGGDAGSGGSFSGGTGGGDTDGVKAFGKEGGFGIIAYGGDTGDGIVAYGGNITGTGRGIKAYAGTGGNGEGVHGEGNGAGVGVSGIANGSGAGLYGLGGNTGGIGYGVYAKGGAGSPAVYADSTDGIAPIKTKVMTATMTSYTAGSIWIKGNDLWYSDSVGDPRRLTGILVAPPV